jgi:NADH-quinone oxidoreductase subunit A
MRAQLELFSTAAVLAMAASFVGLNLLVGRLLRPHAPNPAKAEAYECGEVPEGPARGRFDVRFYVVALVFLVFDVEVALLLPWAAVFGEPGAAGAALFDFLVFAGLTALGFAFLWRRGALDFQAVAAAPATPAAPEPAAPLPAATTPPPTPRQP